MKRETLLDVNKAYVRRLVENGERMDGRDMDAFRDLTLDAGFIRETAEGSAYVELGDTKMVVGIKADTDTPYDDSPDQGTLITNAELAPIASTEWESGPPTVEAVELARVVDRGIRESGLIDLEDLSIEEGERCWAVFVDIHVLDFDGNLIDAAFLGAVAALHEAVLPAYDADADELDREERGEPLPVNGIPVTVTGRRIGDRLLLDTTGAEEDVTGARLTVTLNDDDNVVSLQKGGDAPLSHDQVMDVVEYTRDHADMLRDAVRDAQ